MLTVLDWRAQKAIEALREMRPEVREKEVASRKQTRWALMLKLAEHLAPSTEIWQERPYTAVRVCVAWRLPEGDGGSLVDGISHMAYGFSKCRWPDEWNPDVGVAIAMAKALSSIAKNILDEEGVEKIAALLNVES